jgi:drug/metabolite transporter (DMT)-like permease
LEIGVSEIGQRGSGDGTAKLMLVVLGLTWGITWPLMKIALTEIPPFSMRLSTTALGALTLAALTKLQRRDFRIPNARAWAHIVVASLLNVVGFSLLTAFAQLSATTARVAVLAYTIPIWATLLARPILGERLTPFGRAALVLCAAGLTVLISAQAAGGLPGVLLAIGSGLSWAFGTVYLKWARIGGDPLAVTTWQVIIAFLVIGPCVPIFEGSLHLWPVHRDALFGLLFAGVIGSGFGYFLWFDIVRRLPATIAALGVLSVPAFGVVTSIVLLGERLTIADIIGFALIFAASACVLVPTSGQATAAAS